ALARGAEHHLARRRQGRLAVPEVAAADIGSPEQAARRQVEAVQRAALVPAVRRSRHVHPAVGSQQARGTGPLRAVRPPAPAEPARTLLLTRYQTTAERDTDQVLLGGNDRGLEMAETPRRPADAQGWLEVRVVHKRSVAGVGVRRRPGIGLP